MANYKESGIEWVGNIPKTWDVMPNKRIMHKHKILCEKYNNEDILSLTIKGVIVRDLEAGGKIPTTFDGYQVVYPNNLLMCLFDYDVTPRCIGLIKNEGLTSPAYSQFILDNGNYPGYYYYYYLMIDHTKELLHLSKNLRHSFTEEQLGEIYTPVPPIKDQIKIANYLDKKVLEIDNIIEKTKETIEEYKKYKQSVITEAVTKGLNKNIKFKDSKIEKIGNIPEDWKMIKNKYLYRIISGNGFPNNLQGRKEGTIPFCKNSDINGTDIYVENAQNYIEMDDVIEYKFNVIPKNSILYGKIGEALKKNHRKLNKIECCIDNNVQASVLCNLKEYTIKYGYYYFKSIDMADYDNGGTIPTINNYNLRNTYFVVPPIKKQEQIANYLDAKCTQINSLISIKEKIVEELEQYKKSLIYEYVTGKKEVI